MSSQFVQPTHQVTSPKRKARLRRSSFSALRDIGVVYFLLVFVVLIVLVPLLWAISASFTPNELVFEHAYPFSWRALFPTDFTLDPYIAIFQRGFGRAIINSMILGIVSVIFGGLMSAMAGFAFARFDFPAKRLLFGLILFTFMVPAHMTVIPVYILVNDLGWINTWQGLIVPGLVNSLVIFLFTQFFKDIPQDLLDAARVDGATWLQLFTRVVLPVSKPVLITAALIIFLGQWSEFFWPLLVAPAPELRVVQVAVAQAVGEFQTVWNELLAGSMLAGLIPILLVLPLQRYYLQGIMGSGLKE